MKQTQTNVTDFLDWYQETFKSNILPFGTDYGSLGSLILSLYNHPARKMRFVHWMEVTGEDQKLEALKGLPDLSFEQVEEVLSGLYADYLEDLDRSTLWLPMSREEFFKEIKENF